MGCADVVPGVSGGTIALILGIYERLVGAVRMAGRPLFWRQLLRGHLRSAARTVDLAFLLSVLTGILFAVLSLARALEWALENQPVLVWSFFFGLILASVAVVARRIARWSAALVLLAAAGAVGTWSFVGAVPVQTSDAWWSIFLSGAIAVCAMILPGVSGAFLLVFLGKYEFMLGAVNDRDFAVLAVFAAGALVGVVTFAQLLGWLLRRHHDMTVALLIGFMAGSLRRIWPWKEETAGDATPADIASNVLPAWTVDGAFNLEILWGVLLAAAGLAVVLVLQRVATRGPHEGGSTG
jgi:putative membrane protein